MEEITGYVRVLASARFQQHLNQPFFGKPYLKYGQCFGIWSYFFQLGCILGTKYSSKLDAFGHAFLGLSGPDGEVKKLFTEIAKIDMQESITESMTFADFVGRDFANKMGYSGDVNSFFIKFGIQKITPTDAEELAWLYSSHAAALGAIYPNQSLKMFNKTYAPVPKEEWERVRTLGLNIPLKQDLMSYQVAEATENGLFMEYCKMCCPDYFNILNVDSGAFCPPNSVLI